MLSKIIQVMTKNKSLFFSDNGGLWIAPNSVRLWFKTGISNPERKVWERTRTNVSSPKACSCIFTTAKLVLVNPIFILLCSKPLRQPSDHKCCICARRPNAATWQDFCSMKSLLTSSLHLSRALSWDSPCTGHRVLCLAAEPPWCRGALRTDIGHRQQVRGGFHTSLHQKVALGPAHSPRRTSRSAAALSPGAALLRVAGRTSGFGRARLKFAGAAFRGGSKAKLANKKPLVDKRALRVNNWLSSLNP